MGYKPDDVMVLVDDGHGWETVYGYKSTPKFTDGKWIREASFNHPTKELLKKELKRLGFNVYDVSPERTDTSLKTRVDRANTQYNKKKYKLYIFISIHFNSIGAYWNDNIGGIETYYYRDSSKSKQLATKIHNRLIKGTDLKNRGVKGSGFYVLKYTKMIASLLECGFMSNHTEANLMLNIAYQQECARECTQGICDYIGYKWTPQSTDKTLEELTKIVSPSYHTIWVKHFKANSNLNWLGFIESALKKDYPK